MINRSPHIRHPKWLDKKINLRDCHDLHTILDGLKLNTVCREAACPNIGECSAAKVATMLILGKICTRGCKFCAVRKGRGEMLDPDEPRRVAEAVRVMGLRHVVVTSVTRDDLGDGGASTFRDTIRAIRALDPAVTIEVLVPDFSGDEDAVRTVIDARPDVFAHNLETVPRLYISVRAGADYERSLAVLRAAKRFAPERMTKSGLMLGLGERDAEVLEVLRDLRDAKCDFLSMGQYLAPSRAHHPVAEYIEPQCFDRYKEEALRLGFRAVESGPYVRSSYHAGNYLK